MRVVVVNKSGRKIGTGLIKKNSLKILRKLGGNWTVGIFFVSEREIKALNKKYRRKNRPTDVLSFEMKDEGYLGDVIISPDVAKRNAKRCKARYNEEIARLVIHGILHLKGYDHEKKKDETKMFRKQDRLLKEVWGR